MINKYIDRNSKKVLKKDIKLLNRIQKYITLNPNWLDEELVDLVIEWKYSCERQLKLRENNDK